MEFEKKTLAPAIPHLMASVLGAIRCVLQLFPLAGMFWGKTAFASVAPMGQEKREASYLQAREHSKFA